MKEDIIVTQLKNKRKEFILDIWTQIAVGLKPTVSYHFYKDNPELFQGIENDINLI